MFDFLFDIRHFLERKRLRQKNFIKGDSTQNPNGNISTYNITDIYSIYNYYWLLRILVYHYHLALINFSNRFDPAIMKY